MKKCVILVVAVMVLIPAAGAWAEDVNREFDGIWIGKGGDFYSTFSEAACWGGEIPVAFVVEDGIARSLITGEIASFETTVKKNGKIKFSYRDAATESGGWGENSIDIIFTGKLKGTSGKGQVTFGNCLGRWSVEKQE